MRTVASRGAGAGAQSISASRISRTPKLLIAEPKNTGVSLPAKNASKSNGCDAPCTNSMSMRNCAASSANNSSKRGLSMPLMTSKSKINFSVPASNSNTSSRSRWYTPLKLLPLPIGQVIGAQLIFKIDSTSSSKSKESRTSRSHLFINVTIGVLRKRQTSSNLIVCASTPLAASITIKPESTAVNTR